MLSHCLQVFRFEDLVFLHEIQGGAQLLRSGFGFGEVDTVQDLHGWLLRWLGGLGSGLWEGLNFDISCFSLKTSVVRGRIVACCFRTRFLNGAAWKCFLRGFSWLWADFRKDKVESRFSGSCYIRSTLLECQFGLAWNGCLNELECRLVNLL